VPCAPITSAWLPRPAAVNRFRRGNLAFDLAICSTITFSIASA
jgi:hypothetical protein